MRIFAFFISVMMSALSIPAFAADKMVIDTFSDGDQRSEAGGWWYTYDDARLGGNSQCAPSPGGFTPTQGTDSQGWAARLTGLTGTKLGWDFFGMGVTLTEDSGCPTANPVDISAYSTLEFKIKGSASAGRLTVALIYSDNTCQGNLPNTKTAWADYQAAVTADLSATWTTVKLDLRNDFAQPFWTKAEHVVSIEEVLRQAHVIQWHFSSADGDTLDLWIDDIMLY